MTNIIPEYFTALDSFQKSQNFLPIVSNDVLFQVIVMCLAISISLITYIKSERNIERRSIDDLIAKFIDLTMQYPRFESRTFCSKWNGNLETNESIKYDNYCCFLFNILERLSRYTKADKNKMGKIFYFEELVILHKRWWEFSKENQEGYDKNFASIIVEILRK